MRASVAGILDLPIDQVPDFTNFDGWESEHPENGYPLWYLALQKWAAGKGYMFLEVRLDRRTWNPIPFETACIMFGPHETGCRHAIVGKCEGDGFFPIFDPLGGDPAKAFIGGTIDAVGFLVPIDPALQVKLGKGMDKALRLARQLPPSSIRDALLEVCGTALKVEEPVEFLELLRPPNINGSEKG